MPKASIVIPAYNAEAFIKAALESVFSQTCQDFECIVVDDGSTDSTAQIVKSFIDERLHYHRIDNSGGPARPRNIGIQRATGDFVFLFDADDVMHPQKLELSISALQQCPEADLLFSNYSSIDMDGNLLKSSYLDEYESLWALLSNPKCQDFHFIKKDVLYPALVKVNFIGTSSVVLRKSALSIDDQFNENLRNSDDRLFMANFSIAHHGVFLNNLLHSYRIRGDGISNRDFSDRGVGKIEALKIMKEKCPTRRLQKQINCQISKDYAAISYDYKDKKYPLLQFNYALKSINYRLNWWALKLSAHALLFMIINRMLGKSNHG